MKTYLFSLSPSERCLFIPLENYNLYLNNTLMCHCTYSVLLAHTLSGKSLSAYNINGEKIFTKSLPTSIEKICYKLFDHSIYFRYQ